MNFNGVLKNIQIGLKPLLKQHAKMNSKYT